MLQVNTCAVEDGTKKLTSQSLSAALELDENFVIVRLEDSGLAIKVAVCCPDHHPHTVEDCVCS